jgi:hypothetical protein
MNIKKRWFIKRSLIQLLWLLKAIVLLSAGLLVTNAYAEIQKRTVIGSTTTGWNKNFSSPIANFPGDVGIFGFRTISQYNPNGDAIPITGPLPDSTLIATFLDPEWVNSLGFPPEILEIAKNNIPHREIPVRIDTGGVNKATLRGLVKLNQMDFGLASPAYPLTLGDWLRVRGEMEMTCYDNKFSHVKAKFSGLIPNLVYTLREWFRPGTEFIAVPGVFGGAPASFIADKFGNGEYFIKLPVCPPMSAEQVDHPLFAIALTVNLAHESGGLIPVFPLNPVDPSFPGERAFGQLFFPLTGERLVPGAGPVSDINDWLCEEIDMLESELHMESPTAPAIGLAKVVIDGKVKYPMTKIIFVRLPEQQDDGSLTYLATIRFDFEDSNVIDGFIEGVFIPTRDPNIVENKSVARFVGGEGSFSPAIGDFLLGGGANFDTLIASITGKGKICTPSDI